MYTLVHIPVRRVYSLSRRKDECVERRRRQLRYSSKGSQHKGVAAGMSRPNCEGRPTLPQLNGEDNFTELEF